MSSRTAERTKAVRKAWEREQLLVSSGEGTRDWTPDQQQSILDIGIALDDEGKPFEGQHMKSVAAYPEYAGDPNNIQFLTRQEHLEAHDGSWQNQTNWYYDPITKQKFPFADALVPCKVIQLSNPIILPLSKGIPVEIECEPIQKKANVPEDDANARVVANRPPTSGRSYNGTTRAHDLAPIAPKKIPKGERKIIKAIKSVGRFIVEHPFESLEIAGVVVTGILRIVASSSSPGSISDTTDRESAETFEDDQSPSTKNDIASAVADIIEKANRSSPREHEVPGHGQHYHTKDGVIWREKDPYRRGGPKE